VEVFWQTLVSEFTDSSASEVAKVGARLLVAGVLGSVIGFQREKRGKAAGLRTHVLVAMGTAFMVLGPVLSGMEEGGLSRVIQGVLTGMGFIGAGTILKHKNSDRIEGLTTAAGLWFTVAVGVAVGLGREVSAMLATGLGVLVFYFVPHLSRPAKKGARFISPDGG
jgi:putative Mg2+ transporter-C (MgtC) family protein